ncbi:hypothetical protein D3C84_422580 [compost metagenome]
MGHWQYGYVGLGILLLAMNRQRPEMRRGPGEDDQHQQQGLSTDMPGDRHPAEQGWRRAGQPADHDILRRRTLEEAGIDHRIPQQRREGQPRRQRIGEHQQHGLPAHRQDQRKRQRGRGGHPAFGQWPLVGAGHDRVDPPIHHMVDRRRATGAQGDP